MYVCMYAWRGRVCSGMDVEGKSCEAGSKSIEKSNQNVPL